MPNGQPENESPRQARIREQNFRFVRRAFGWALAVTLAMFLLEGFHVLGFSLDVRLLYFLGTATVGEIAGLFAMVLKFK